VGGSAGSVDIYDNWCDNWRHAEALSFPTGRLGLVREAKVSSVSTVGSSGTPGHVIPQESRFPRQRGDTVRCGTGRHLLLLHKTPAALFEQEDMSACGTKRHLLLPQENWYWDINPLVPGWGTGPEKTRFPECLVLPYTGTWFSSGFGYRADF
jgi:hypothetical protein